MIKEAAQKGAQIVALPECFNSPYGTKYFPEYAEKIPGESTCMLSDVAKECGIYLIGGSIPEEDSGKLYNTCAVYGPDGRLLVKHRKVHLFDINVPGKIRFQESETLCPGDNLTVFDTPYCKVGVGICYDIRFAEMAQIYAQKGCQLLIYPGAFNMTTGPAHWELLQRARALDNQVYVATASPARDEKATYVAWGHSTIVSPWGDVIAKAGSEEATVFADIGLAMHRSKRTFWWVFLIILALCTDLFGRTDAGYFDDDDEEEEGAPRERITVAATENGNKIGQHDLLNSEISAHGGDRTGVSLRVILRRMYEHLSHRNEKHFIVISAITAAGIIFLVVAFFYLAGTLKYLKMRLCPEELTVYLTHTTYQCLYDCGGNRNARRKPTQARGEHTNSLQMCPRVELNSGLQRCKICKSQLLAQWRQCGNIEKLIRL
ncbi:hypothetical protein GDO86_002860 [Hymenochirus boettgeri]|uniref:omega-amidase n=1 Tax=Hymenochirus boettgeri TaxID=247094 RepID=A0A8T2K1X6_9PIPI|nr:hypothetical protein GDO86_002860 [Hymenochirus boettgeri]